MSTKVTVSCPACGEGIITALVSIDPGEPEVRYEADGSGYPGSPPTIGEIERIDYDCDCHLALDRSSTLEYNRDVDDLIFDADFEYDPSEDD